MMLIFREVYRFAAITLGSRNPIETLMSTSRGKVIHLAPY